MDSKIAEFAVPAIMTLEIVFYLTQYDWWPGSEIPVRKNVYSNSEFQGQVTVRNYLSFLDVLDCSFEDSMRTCIYLLMWAKLT